MSFLPIDLTTALRPSLLPDETLLFVQDGVGLYEGKNKAPAYQNGHAYLTSHRACYVDNEHPRRFSVAIDLKSVDRYELYVGFLKSSPKVTLYIKSTTRLPALGQAPTPITPLFRSGIITTALGGDDSFRLARSSPVHFSAPKATWICPICTFSNFVPASFDVAAANVHTPLNACLSCGIKPPLAHVLKAAIAQASNRQASAGIQTSSHSPGLENCSSVSDSDEHSTSTPWFAGVPQPSVPCPRCTFLNHPSLLTCEVCGSPLQSEQARKASGHPATQRADTPGPSLSTQNFASAYSDSVKFSFRAGGERVFFDRLKGALVQRKWLLQNAPPVPRTGRSPGSPADGTLEDRIAEPFQRQRMVGIAGLERRGLELRHHNQFVIGNAFEDLEALMASAKEVIALAESFANRSNPTSKSISPEATAVLSQSADALGLVTTKDMLSSGGGSESLYLSELSRNMAEFLTDDTRGILHHEGGIMSLVDLWAMFNRARGGVELVSPMDFEKAAKLWGKLKLPVRLRKFKSGLLVVQGGDWNDDRILANLTAWLSELHWSPMSPDGVQWDRNQYGSGVSPQQVAERFGWSVGVANEELEMAEERGVLCREEGVQGLKFWENWLLEGTDLTNGARLSVIPDLREEM